jgi:hypothetical protein
MFIVDFKQCKISKICLLCLHYKTSNVPFKFISFLKTSCSKSMTQFKFKICLILILPVCIEIYILYAFLSSIRDSYLEKIALAQQISDIYTVQLVHLLNKFFI